MKTQTRTQVVVLLVVLFLGYTLIFKREEYGTESGTPQGTSEGTKSGTSEETEMESPPPVKKQLIGPFTFAIIFIVAVIILAVLYALYQKSDYAKKSSFLASVPK
jgi:hypothetical protein